MVLYSSDMSKMVSMRLWRMVANMEYNCSREHVSSPDSLESVGGEDGGSTIRLSSLGKGSNGGNCGSSQSYGVIPSVCDEDADGVELDASEVEQH